MNYKNGKIYQILNTVNDKVYIGSTCTQLSRRMVHHRKCSLTQNSPLYEEMRLHGFDKFYIELLELFPGSSKDELTARENSIIRERGASLNSLSHYKAKTRSNKTQTDIIDTKPADEETEPPQPVEPLENEVLTEHQPQENNNELISNIL